MSRYTVPQFADYQPKIVGPLTWKQFVFIGGAGAVCFSLYFIIPFYFFILASAVIILIGAGLAFGKVSGRSLPEILKNFTAFSFSPKIYLWKKKASPLPKLITEPQIKKEEPSKTPVPTMVGKSRLKDLSTQIEAKR